MFPGDGAGVGTPESQWPWNNTTKREEGRVFLQGRLYVGARDLRTTSGDCCHGSLGQCFSKGVWSAVSEASIERTGEMQMEKHPLGALPALTGCWLWFTPIGRLPYLFSLPSDI